MDLLDWTWEGSVWWLGPVSLEKVPSWDYMVLLRDFNFNFVNSGETQRGVIGRNSMPDLNPSAAFLLDTVLVTDWP